MFWSCGSSIQQLCEQMISPNDHQHVQVAKVNTPCLPWLFLGMGGHSLGQLKCCLQLYCCLYFPSLAPDRKGCWHSCQLLLQQNHQLLQYAGRMYMYVTDTYNVYIYIKIPGVQSRWHHSNVLVYDSYLLNHFLEDLPFTFDPSVWYICISRSVYLSKY